MILTLGGLSGKTYIGGGRGSAGAPPFKAVLCNSHHINFQKLVNHDRDTLIEQSPYYNSQACISI